MSNIQTGAERMPHDLSHLGFLAGQIGRLITISTTPVIAGDSFELDAVGALRLSPLRRGLAIDSTVDMFTFYVPHRHVPLPGLDAGALRGFDVVVEAGPVGQHVELHPAAVERLTQVVAVAAGKALDLVVDDELHARGLTQLAAELPAFGVEHVAQEPGTAHHPGHLRPL